MDGKRINFIIDSGSPITIIPNHLKPNKQLQTVEQIYTDVNKNRVEIDGKCTVTVETPTGPKQLELIISKRNDFTPLVGLNWFDDLQIEIRTNNNRAQIRTVQSENVREQMHTKFKKLFEENTTVKDTKVKIQLKPDVKPVQQKARPIPLHLQDAVEKEIQKLIASGHIEKLEEVPENTFISPAVITVKKDKSVKIALDSRKLNENCIKRRPNMPNMEDLINRISTEISKNDEDELWISKIDLDYAYGQLELDEETKKHCVFALIGGKVTGFYRFLKGFYGLSDLPTIFQEKMDRTLKFKTPAWIDDIIIVTRGEKSEHIKRVEETLTELQDAGYRAGKEKTEFCLKETVWLGHHISKSGIKPNEEKTLPITNLEHPRNPKELKSFLGAVQYFAKFIKDLSKLTDRMRQLLKKNTEWEWTEERENDFRKVKETLAELPCLTHFSPKRENIITTDASKHGLGAILWQTQSDGNRKPIQYASRYLNDAEKRYSTNELELLAVVWGLEHFRFYIYGKPVKLFSDHSALEPLLRRNRANKIYSARLTRWLDRIAHFDVSVNHIAGEEIKLTDYLSRHPTSKAEAETNYEEEYVINAIAPLYYLSARINGLTDKHPTNELTYANEEQSDATHSHLANKIGKSSEQTLTAHISDVKIIPLPNQHHASSQIKLTHPKYNTVQNHLKWTEINNTIGAQHRRSWRSFGEEIIRPRLKSWWTGE